MRLKKYLFRLLIILVVILQSCNSGKKSKVTYEIVENDPLKARIYTLDNGLKVYMTVYKDAPRIQTYIAVKAGSKNDPADATGLAHYLEHMLFKGTDKYGSKDFVKEEPEIKKIETLYDEYRQLKDPAKRKAMYHLIDSISGVASKFAIANEYDKLMASIGTVGSNAYTSNEQTVYVEDIPSNQLEKWAAIQSERYRKPVMRLFHTELEAVYEEKNRTLDNDNDKVFEALFSGLFQKHTYGSQTTIGTIEHLKNPSITKINDYFNTYYVPNNMAICLSGDFDPDSAIKVIEQKFSGFKNKPVPTFIAAKEDPITKPIAKEVLGPNAEELAIGFRFAGAGSDDANMITLIAKILSNGKAGLIDLNLNQKQEVLNAVAFPYILKDYSTLIFDGQPKQGQSLNQLKELMLQQLEKIKQGDFPDWLLNAIINNMKLEEIKAYEDNSRRADAFVRAFTTDIKWQDYVGNMNRLSAISKQQIVDFAKSNFNNNYVAVYKRTGEDKNVQKVEKPAITPVEVNRNDESKFVKDLVSRPSPTIEPVFIDYEKDIKKFNAGNIPILYHENTENKTFDMHYVVNMGTNQNKKLKIAIDYLNYLGTSKHSPQQVQQEFYKLGCSYKVFSSEDETRVSLNGLSENFEKALALFEDLLNDAQPNPDALNNLVSDILKKRQDDMLDKNTILYGGMLSYGIYGSTSPFTNILSEAELKVLKPEDLISIIKNLNSYEHHILYYGTLPERDLTAVINKLHKVPAKLNPVPPDNSFAFKPTTNNVYVVNYDMKQAEIIMVSKGEQYNKDIVPNVTLFNEYFGGGMASIVFQDLRESKALAYSVSAVYRNARRKDKNNYIISYIGTQSDKLPEAMSGMTELINNMPESENTFKSAKESVLQGLRTERITKSDILFNYEKNRKLGLDHDIRKDIYDKVPAMTTADIKKFQQQYMKDKTYTVLVLGKKENLDFKTLEKYGKINFLQLKDIFGYDKTQAAEKVLN
jgi:predicted Zn-dependent peptidase